MEPIILASTSPRRQEILKNLGIPFSVFSPDYDEPMIAGLSPAELAEMHSIKKVESIMRTQLNINAPWILGADTLISLDGAIYGKPADRESARSMIARFAGKTHQVITAITLYDSRLNFISSRTSSSDVTFTELDDGQIEQYLNSGEWQGVAGGYRIQGLGAFYVSKIVGSYSGIVGLPIHELYAILREHGYVFPN